MMFLLHYLFLVIISPIDINKSSNNSIYLRGRFELFASADCVARLPQSTRQLFFQILRLYHEQKIGQSNPIAHLSLPQQNNITEIVEFQKNMFKMIKHLVPT